MSIRLDSVKPGVRRIVTGRNRKIVGYIPSIKAEGLLPAESQLEMRGIRLLDISPKVASLEAQPFTLKVVLGSRIYQYTPDLFIKTIGGGRAVAEIKAAEIAEDPEVRPFLASAARAIGSAYGCSYLVLTERTIDVEPAISNAKELSRWKYREVPTEHVVIFETFLAPGPRSLSAMVKHACARGIASEVSTLDIAGLAAQGRFAFDLNQPWGDQILLSLNTADTDVSPLP